MKTIKLKLTIALLIGSTILAAQNNRIPKVYLYTLDCESVSSQDVLNGKDAAIVIFWKTNDKDSQEQISDMIDAHREILLNKNVRLIGICIDCSGSIAHIKPFVAGHDWEMEMYIDKNAELKRKLGVNDTPATIVFNKGNEIVCQYNGYCSGTDVLICKKLSECLASSGKVVEVKY